MSAARAVAVTGIGLWLPGFPSREAWVARRRDVAQPKPLGRAFDRVNRRRSGALGRAIADAGAEAMEEARSDPATVASVIGSAVGEASTMIGLLNQMWRDKTPMSPAAFTVSVHNAASGLLSISCRNQGYATSLAADEDTPAAALMEGIGLVAAGAGAVLVVCADEAIPAPLAREAPSWELMAAAVVLEPLDAARRRASLAVVRGEPATLAAAAVDPAVALNPQVGLVDLVDALLRGEAGRVALDRGTGRGFLAEIGFHGA
jgi:hypothetical protein